MTVIKCSNLLTSLFLIILTICFISQISSEKLTKSKNLNFIQKSSLSKKSKITKNSTIKVKGDCNKTTCENGKCEKSYCVCKEGYGQVDETNKDSPNYNKLCNYQLKDQLLAFLLEAFLVFGVGHFYTHRILYGLIKCVIFISIILLDLLLKRIFVSKKSNTTSNIVCLISYFLYFVLISFHLYDIMLFAVNRHTDGYAMPLYAR